MKPLAVSLALILAILPDARPAVAGEGVAMNESRYLITFDDSSREHWSPVNDVVMGGVSRSAISQTEYGTGLFSGYLSLENNGGFASVRTPVNPAGLTAHTGLMLKVKGDGRTYQLRLRTDDRFDGVSYRAAFPTEAGQWTTITLPFNEFQPTFRGRLLSDVPPLDPADIRQLAFMVADKTQGAFALEIDFVRAWSPVAVSP